MNPLFLAKRIWNNKHTSGAAAVYVAAKVGSELGAVWLPSHAEQFKQTANILESGAIGYGLVMAGDSEPSNKKILAPDTETDEIKKP